METPWKLLPICRSGHVLQARGKHFCVFSRGLFLSQETSDGWVSLSGGRDPLSRTVLAKEQPPASSRNQT